MKAIQIAASQGQKVYTVNASNASAALAASGAGGEIKEAIQAGMEVTFHERGINAHGWSGTGYSIVNPETGVGRSSFFLFSIHCPGLLAPKLKAYAILRLARVTYSSGMRTYLP